MDPFLLVLGAGAVVAAAPRVRRHLQGRRSGKQRAQAELAAIRHLAESDAVLFGEELARLDAAVGQAGLDEESRTDYQTALDSYESALRTVDRLGTIDDVVELVNTLSVGRYAVACVRARVEGGPLPAYRIPCFFDPRHGPASTDVLWNPPGQGTRKVPACAQDAARKAVGDEPDLMTVRVDGRQVPYWAAGGLHRPYENEYTPRTPREAIIDHKASYSLYDNPVDRFGGFSM